MTRFQKSTPDGANLRMKLPTVPGLEIALSVNGQDLHEYDDEADADGAEYTRYVEAVPGANFAIQFRPDRRFQYSHNTLELKVYLDGVSTQGKVYSPKARTGGHTAHTVTGKTEQIGGRGFRRKFAFADLKTSESRTFISRIGGLGTNAAQPMTSPRRR